MNMKSWVVGHHVDNLVLVIGGRDFLQCGLHAPDLTGILGNGAIAGELATSSNVIDHLLGPFLGVLMGRWKWQIIRRLWLLRSSVSGDTITSSEKIYEILIFSWLYLVKFTDILLAFNIVFIVSKDLKPVQERMQLFLMQIHTWQLHSRLWMYVMILGFVLFHFF